MFENNNRLLEVILEPKKMGGRQKKMRNVRNVGQSDDLTKFIFRINFETTDTNSRSCCTNKK